VAAKIKHQAAKKKNDISKSVSGNRKISEKQRRHAAKAAIKQKKARNHSKRIREKSANKSDVCS